MATDETPKSPECPTCKGPLTYVKDAPEDIRPTTKGGVSAAFASEIYRCPTHGLWRSVMGGEPMAYQDPDA